MPEALTIAGEIVKNLSGRNMMIAAAESCTAGLAADLIARIPGASSVFWGSFVSYAVDAKSIMLGIREEFINEHGAVSRHVALEMAEKALEKSGVFWAFSVTGIAGPGGGSSHTPIGTVWIAISGKDGDGGSLRSEAKKFLFGGSRNEIREAAALKALELLLERINEFKA